MGSSKKSSSLYTVEELVSGIVQKGLAIEDSVASGRLSREKAKEIMGAALAELRKNSHLATTKNLKKAMDFIRANRVTKSGRKKISRVVKSQLVVGKKFSTAKKRR